MRIGMMSDTHGDPVAWDRALDALGRVDLMLHAGDVLYHGAFNPITPTYEPKRLIELLNSSTIPRVHARGNCDSEVDQLALDDHILSDTAFVSAEGVRILVCHGHRQTEEQLIEMGRRAGVAVLHRGHTHVPGFVRSGGLLVVNAGSCALPKQEGGVPTVAVLDGGTVSIIDIDSGDVIETAECNK